MSRRWSTDEEFTFLKSKVAGYHQARKDNRVTRYTDGVFEDWFKSFPEKPRVLPDVGDRELTKEEQTKLNEAVEQRRKQIRSWLLRATAGTSRNKATVQLNRLASKVQGASRSRRLQGVEIFQKEFKDDLKPLVDAALKESKATTRQETMAVRRRVVQEAFDKASDEAKATVKERQDRNVEELKLRKAHEKRAIVEDEVVDRTPEQYDMSIRNLSSLMDVVMRPIAEATGWVFFVAAGGPRPDANGDVFMQDYYFRPKGMEGAEFVASHIGYKEGVELPFAQHIENLFAPDIRAARALTSLNSVLANTSLHQLARSTSPPPSSAQVPEGNDMDRESDTHSGAFDGDDDDDDDDDDLLDMGIPHEEPRQEPPQSSPTVVPNAQVVPQPSLSTTAQPLLNGAQRSLITDDLIDPSLLPEKEPIPPPPIANPGGVSGPQHDYLVSGSIISGPLIEERITPPVPTLTPAQKAAITRREKKSLAAAKAKEIEVNRTVTGARVRGGGLNADGTAIQLPVKRKRAEKAESTMSAPKSKKKK
ncbi:hypothetical protein H0H93_016573 [Arthromyces matolae]|nr:hypothetical protein H0H93_016573 [Arthromyces matolae]